MGLDDFSIVGVVEFQVLGPMRVRDAGEPFPLGGPKQRTLLALLVASAGSPVPTDSLLMGVYGPDADPKSRRTLHTYISRYRSSLGDVIERRGDGYALLVEPMSIDAVRFEDAVRRADSLIEPSEAAQSLRDALGLWRGRPYADIETAALDAEARRLEELKAEATEARIALDLAAGRHRELLAELETLVAEHPERERLRAHQMLALYRCGRQGDALDAYHEAATHLRDELGLEPSPELRRLEEQILEQDGALDYRPRPRRRPLPARYTSFVGREDEVSEVQRLVESHRLVTITGPGGVGKSTLASEAARTLTDRLHVVFVPIEAERQEGVAVLIARSLGLQPTDETDVLEMIATALDVGVALVVLDGCEHVIDELPPVIAELLHRSPEARILITSREPLLITGEQRLVLGPLPVGVDSPATRLFIDRAAIPRSALDDDVYEAAARIAKEVSGLPLGIELAAARHRSMSLDEIARQLDDQTRLLATKRGPEPRHLSIVNALDWSYELLDGSLQRTFRQLAVFPTGMIPTDGAAAVLEIADPIGLLHDLVDLSLLSPPDDAGRFRILEPIRQYAEMKLDEAGERLAAERRHARWLVELAGGLEHLALMGHAETAYPRLRAQAPAIAAAATWLIEEGEPDLTLELVARLGRIWPNVADPRLLREPAMAVLQSMKSPLSDQAVAALASTAVLHRLDDPETARRLETELRSEAEHVEDPVSLQTVNWALFRLAFGVERRFEPTQVEEAYEHWRTSVDLLAELGYPIEVQYRNGSIVLREMGRDAEAEAMVRSMAEFAGESRPIVRGLALESLAQFMQERGELVAALEACREAARLLLDGGDLDFAAEAERRRATTLELLEQYDEAQDALRRHDEYHALIGLPPIAEEEPLLVTATLGALEQWEEFTAVMRAYAASAPTPADGPEYEQFLVGEPLRLEHFARMIRPMARWLMSRGRRDAAVSLIAAAPMAFEETAFTLWDEVGDVARVERLIEELGDPASADPPATLDELWRFMVECLEEG